MVRRASRPERRGMVLFTVLITVVVLLWGGMLLASRASTDLEIAAAGRRGAVSFTAAQSSVAQILSDGRITLPASTPAPTPDPGFSPDPGSASLEKEYSVSPLDPNTKVSAHIRYLREGPAGESSAVLARSLVYEVHVAARYEGGGAQKPRSVEFYRLAPKPPGYVSPVRHYH